MLRSFGRFTVAASQTGELSFRPRTVQSNFNGAGGGGGFGTSASVGLRNTEQGILEGLLDIKNPIALRKIMRDMYHHDPICGMTADLMSTLPFGDFTLSGVPAEMLSVYIDSVESTRMNALFPRLSLDYLVNGAFLGILNYNKGKRIFDTVVTANLDYAEIKSVPIFGQAPVVDLKFPAEVRKFLNDKDARFDPIRASVTPDLLNAMKSGGKIQLQPNNMLYIPRQTFSYEGLGTSYFQRCLAVFLLEKALMRGTIDMAHRRQRGILHLMAGGEDWEPTPDELAGIANVFMAADNDPLGAVVATRQDIQMNEVQNGGEFWKYEDIYENATTMKLRALGISEAFLSGDANFNTVEATLSVFIQQLKAYREMICRTVLYEKMFPYIAITNDFVREEKHEVHGSVSDHEVAARLRKLRNGQRIQMTEEGTFYATISDAANPLQGKLDLSKYHTPIVSWHNHLQPESDSGYLELLESLSEKGFPVPLRIMTAAAGLNLDDILEGKNDDLAKRKELQAYIDSIAKISGGDQEGGEGEEGYSDDMQALSSFLQSPSGITPIGLANRKYDLDELGVRMYNKAGRRRSLSKTAERMVEENIHRHVASALAENARKSNWRSKDGFQRKSMQTPRTSQVWGRLRK